MVSFVSTLITVAAVAPIALGSPFPVVLEKRTAITANGVSLDFGTSCAFVLVNSAALTFGAGVLLPSSTIASGYNMFNVYSAGAITGLGLGGAVGKQTASTFGSVPNALVGSAAYGSYVYSNTIGSQAATDMGTLMSNVKSLTASAVFPAGANPQVGPGVYTFPAAAAIPSLTLVGTSTSVFVFVSVGAMNLAAGTVITLASSDTAHPTNLPLASNIIWYSGGAYNAGAGSTVYGSVLAVGAVTIAAGCKMTSNIFTAAASTIGAGVTLNNVFTTANCAGPASPPTCLSTINGLALTTPAAQTGDATADYALYTTLLTNLKTATALGGICNPTS